MLFWEKESWGPHQWAQTMQDMLFEPLVVAW
jgi:hypothetical protein